MHVIGDAIEELTAIQQLHDQVDLAPLIVRLQQLADIGMIQLLHDLDLSFESFQSSPIRADHSLDRHLPIRSVPVLGDVHLAVAARRHLLWIDIVILGDVTLVVLDHHTSHGEGAPAARGCVTRIRMPRSVRRVRIVVIPRGTRPWPVLLLATLRISTWTFAAAARTTLPGSTRGCSARTALPRSALTGSCRLFRLFQCRCSRFQLSIPLFEKLTLVFHA
mmetsp:Transcript_24151/g.63424  ORF Transcript_24151/g.63424 Transcript_24151/m.63424 type:complete len:220 (+) Transcript_24151:1577-2236(+)